MPKLLASVGPLAGVVLNSRELYGNTTKFAMSAVNGYIRNPAGVSSWAARPGFRIKNTGAQMGTGQKTQGMHSHIDPATQTIYRFYVVNGVLYRANTTSSAFTVVTPAGITVDASTNTRVSFLSVGSSLVVTDGVNRPWVMSNFASTPVTGAYIDIDGAAGAWSSWGKPTLYEDSVFFIVQTAPGGSSVQPRVGIVWSEPNQPTVGYTQTGYADFWNLIENGTDPLYAILGTNNGLVYWRANAIGLAAGTPSINFSTTATRDAKSTAVGTVSPWAVAMFGDKIFFIDTKARVWMMPLNGDPQPVWQQNTTANVSVSPAAFTPSQLSYLTVGAIAPELNQYVVFYAGTATADAPPISAEVFDAATGIYSGEWVITPAGIGVNAFTVMRDSNGLEALMAVGGEAGANGGYVFQLQSLEGGLGTLIWSDTNTTASAITLAVQTQRLGYAANMAMYPDLLVIVIVQPANGFMTIASVRVSTTYSSNTTPTATNIVPVGFDGDEARLSIGLDGIATRWAQVAITGPTVPDVQWGVQRFELYGTTSGMSPDEY